MARTGRYWLAAVLLLSGLFAALNPAEAGDLADALRFTRDVLGEDAIEGYEEFVDEEPDEALALLLSRRVVPGRHPELYARERDEPPFRDLGIRLDYARLAAIIEEAAAETGLPAALIDAVVRTESGYRPHAVSRAGAIGLMQLMPRTARSLGVRDPFDPRQNVRGGARYLRRLFDRFGTVELALAAYNAGPARVARHRGVPPFKETRRYVRVVMERLRRSPLRARAR